MATLYYRPFTSEPIKDGGLPPHDALENVLPEYQYIFLDSDPKTTAPTQAVAKNVKPTDLDQHTEGVLEYQMRELEKYRTAVRRMGQDILTLRDQVREAENQNSLLRLSLGQQTDATRLLMDSQDLDGITKPELASRYIALKRRIHTQNGDLQSYKDQVQRLQNELIRKNDAEKDLLKMSHAHESQNELLQRLQDKAKRVKQLEDACRKQEKVIEKLEKSSPKHQAQDNSQEKALHAENRRLRADLAEWKEAQRQATPEDENERLEMYEKLERSDSRIRSLEKQLDQNARMWGRERSDLLVKLQEAEHGFWRSAPLHFDYINPKVGREAGTYHHPPRKYTKPPSKPRYNTADPPRF